MKKLIRGVAALDFRIVGCSAMGTQLAASVALLRGIKQARPDVVTILGGACCEGEMAQGIRSLDAGIDYIFSGESEDSFIEFLRAMRRGERFEPGVITGRPCEDLDRLPTPRFTDFYDQVHRFLPQAELASDDRLMLTYQTSRGCWWGRKNRCTFCGFSGAGRAFVQSPSTAS